MTSDRPQAAGHRTQARASYVAAAFLDGLNAASLALMAVVTWQLAGSAVVDAPTAVIAAVAGVALLRFRRPEPLG